MQSITVLRYFGVYHLMSGADAERKIDEDEEQTWSGGHVIDAEGKKLLPQDMSRMLERLLHDALE